jgi:hypothetical protein
VTLLTYNLPAILNFCKQVSDRTSLLENQVKLLEREANVARMELDTVKKASRSRLLNTLG